MKNVYLALALLLTVFGMLLLQEQPASAHPSDRARQSTTRGCMKKATKGFTLTTSSGKTYELRNEFKQLRQFAGTEVEVIGLRGTATDFSTGVSGTSGLSTTNPSAGIAPTIRVSSVKKVSDQCNSSK